MRGKWTFLPLLLCLALLAGCTGTPGAAGTDAPAPAATETAGPVSASPDPTAEPAPALSDREPPLTDYEQSQPAPEFLTAEQQDLYRRASRVYTHLFGGMTNEVEYSDTFPLGTCPNGPAETFQDGEYTYVYSRGRYRNWADFEALVSGVFTEAFFDGKNDAGGGYPIFREKDGRLCFLDLGRGTGDCRNFHFPDTFELLYQSEDEISFYVVGSYSLMYPREGESTAERDARVAAGYEYQSRFPIRMVRTEDGWRFDQFYDTSADALGYQVRSYFDGRAMITVLGLDIMGRPLDTLPGDLQDTLRPAGEEHLLETRPSMASPWVITTYTAPGLEVETLRLDWEHPGDWQSGLIDGRKLYDSFMEYAEEQGGPDREYVCGLRLTDDTYATVPSLRVGDTPERAAELGYPEADDDGNITAMAMLNWGTFYVEDGVITEIYLSDGWRSWGNLVW